MTNAANIIRQTRAALAAAFVALMPMVGSMVGSMVCMTSTAHAQLNLDVPEELKGVDIIENLDAQLPLDARFTDDAGRQVSLRDYFDGKRPVLLQLGYNRCPLTRQLIKSIFG